jgi:UDP-GlcNAc:undecaprenyl-phosphate GlcNAc-1-phosphate transferase
MPILFFISIFTITFALSVFFTYLIRKTAVKLNIIDYPNVERKIHKNPVPLLGGAGIFLAFFIMLFFVKSYILSGSLEPRHWLGVFVGALILLIGGILDDKYNLKPSRQLIFPILAALAVVAGGVGIEKIGNPFLSLAPALGNFIYLDQWRIPVINFGGRWHHFSVIKDGLTIIWLMGMMYTTKLLDGLDGLVSGVSAIGAFIIFLFTMTTKYYQPDVGLVALILCASTLGFLVFNWHPAKIFLGEGGSLLLGFILGVLAIISGGKIAIALLIMGLPIMDFAWTILRRAWSGKNPFKFADKKHLHHQLLNLGLSTRQTAWFFYFTSLAFGLAALFLQSQGKVIALGVLVLIMLGIVIGLESRNKRIV